MSHYGQLRAVANKDNLKISLAATRPGTTNSICVQAYIDCVWSFLCSFVLSPCVQLLYNQLLGFSPKYVIMKSETWPAFCFLSPCQEYMLRPSIPQRNVSPKIQLQLLWKHRCITQIFPTKKHKHTDNSDTLHYHTKKGEKQAHNYFCNADALVSFPPPPGFPFSTRTAL